MIDVKSDAISEELRCINTLCSMTLSIAFRVNGFSLYLLSI